MSDILASVSVVLGAEVSGFKAAMADARKELRGLVQFGEGMKGVGESLTKFVTLPVLGIGGAAVKMAGDMEKAQASFTTMLGSASAASSTLKDLKQFAADTPFEFPEIQGAAKKLLAFNTPASELKETLRELGDVSSGIDAPIGEIADLFGKARVQGRLFQEDINQLTGRGIPIIQELAKQFRTTEGAVRSLVEKGKVNFSNLQQAFADLTKEGGKFGGLMQQQSQTLPGLFSTLSDNVGQALASIGADIVRDLNLKQVLKEVGDFVQGAADAFRSLSPQVKEFIIVGAGIVAAVGPALVVLGSIAVALPAITAGFTLLTGPIGIAAAAFVALGVGAAAYASSSRATTQTFQEQRTQVAELEKSILPLADRYDFLKGKTNLNKAEQEELRRIIEQLGKQMPDTISQFDSYGNALSINTERVRQFADQQRRALTQLNKEKLTEQRAEYARLEAQIKGARNALSDFNEQGQLQKAYFDSGGGGFVPLTAAEITELQTKLRNLLEARKNVGALIDDLKGIKPPLVEAGAAADVTKQKLAALSDGQQKALDGLRKNLLDNANASRALGDLYDYSGGKARVLEAGIKSLTDAGFAPGGKVVQGYVAQLKEVPKAMENISLRPLKGLKDAFETPDFELKVPALNFARPDQVQPLAPVIDPNRAAEQMERATTNLTAAQERMLERRRQFNTNMELLTEQLNASIAPALADIAGLFGEAFGNIITGTQSAGDALTALFGNVLQSIGSFMGDFGKQLIAIGIGKLSLDTLFKGPAGGPLAIAAGLGLVALAGVVSSVGKSAAASVANIGSGGGSGFSSPTTGNYGQASGTQKIIVQVESRLRGPDLVAIGRTEAYRQSRSV